MRRRDELRAQLEQNGELNTADGLEEGSDGGFPTTSLLGGSAPLTAEEEQRRMDLELKRRTLLQIKRQKMLELKDLLDKKKEDGADLGEEAGDDLDAGGDELSPSDANEPKGDDSDRPTTGGKVPQPSTGGKAPGTGGKKPMGGSPHTAKSSNKSDSDFPGVRGA